MFPGSTIRSRKLELNRYTRNTHTREKEVKRSEEEEEEGERTVNLTSPR
jgi:hypothetical protein